MQILFSKTRNHHPTINAGKSRLSTSRPAEPANRPLGWKPQPSGLTRDEMRAAVLEMIG